MNDQTYDLTTPRKTFSRIGLALCAILAVSFVVQLLWITIAEWIGGTENWFVTSSWGIWIISFLPLYAVAIPLGILIMRKLPTEKPQDQKMRFSEFLTFLAIGFFVTYAGNLIGTILSLVLSNSNAENPLLDYALDNNPLKILVMVVLAPVLEEYVCRKQIIDRTRRYGEKTAVLLSAMVFGLLHQNFYQFFYAFGVGLMFAYIYTRTGRLRYTILLHSIYNFMGSVVAPWILSLLDITGMEAPDPTASVEVLLEQYGGLLIGLLVFGLYALFLFGMSIFGLVMLITKSKKLTWQESESPLPKGTAAKTVYGNLGMVLYIIICVVFFVLALL